jgi:hypothetical protein
VATVLDSVEEIDFRSPRGLDRGAFPELCELGFLRQAGNVIITASSGSERRTSPARSPTGR